MTIDRRSLAMIRFQIFREDILDPIINLDSKERGDTGYENIYAFACGELREAMTMASLGVAYDIYPRDQFSTLLESYAVTARMAGNFHDPEGRPERWPPSPVDGLPDESGTLRWSTAAVPESDYWTDEVHRILDTYSSVMRQVQRNEFQRRFNAELLFAHDETCQGEMQALRSAVIPWAAGAIDEPECAWIPEGLDSFLDFALDIGVQVDRNSSGRFEGFNWSDSEWIDLKERDSSEIAFSDSPLVRVAEWRFGGLGYHEQVTERVSQLQSLISEIVEIVEYRFR